MCGEWVFGVRRRISSPRCCCFPTRQRDGLLRGVRLVSAGRNAVRLSGGEGSFLQGLREPHPAAMLQQHGSPLRRAHCSLPERSGGLFAHTGQGLMQHRDF